MSVSVGVCLSVREHISGTTRLIFTKFLCMLPMAVTRSSSDGVRYVTHFRYCRILDDVIFAPSVGFQS